MSDFNDVPAAMSTSALQAKLKDLKEKSNKHSQILTAKLASSQSGQNLLHIGTSLSTLPPDLHSLLTQLHPVLSATEATEKQYVHRLEKLVECGNEIRVEQRRVEHARECADLYQDLLAAEKVVKRDANHRRSNVGLSSPGVDTPAHVQDLGEFPFSKTFWCCSIFDFFTESSTREHLVLVISQGGPRIFPRTMCTHNAVSGPRPTIKHRQGDCHYC